MKSCTGIERKVILIFAMLEPTQNKLNTCVDFTTIKISVERKSLIVDWSFVQVPSLYPRILFQKQND